MSVLRHAHRRARHLLAALLVAAVAVVAAPSAARAAAAEDKCGGRLSFGEIAVCPSITGNHQNRFTVKTTRDNDQLSTMLTRSSGDGVGSVVTDASGAQVCYVGTDASTCQLGAAGIYTITVSLVYGTGSGNYTLAVQSARTPTGCTALANAFFSFASTGSAGSLPFGSPGNCYRFDQPVGSVVRLWSPRAGGGADVQGAILDAAFQPVCTVRYAQYCTLGTAGPYTLILHEAYGTATSYTLRMSRISNAAGCGPLKLAAFGDPGADTGTGTFDAYDAIACHKLRMPSAGTVGVRINDGQQINWTAFDDAGKTVCEGYHLRSCKFPAAGDYTIITQNQGFSGASYSIAAPALFRGAGCTAAGGLSWASDALLPHQTSGVQTNCVTFSGKAGDRIVLYSAPTEYNQLSTWLADANGDALCTTYSDEDGCVLPATGTYRVLSFLGTWNSDSTDLTYKVQIRRLSQPAGCPVVRAGAYNEAPAGALGPIRCRILDIKTPGLYVGRAFDPQNYQTYASVYDQTGHRVCNDAAYCQIDTAGRYTMVLDGRAIASVIDNDYQYVTSLLPYVPSGCPGVTSDGYGSPPLQAEFTAPGQVLCRQITGADGGRVVEVLPTDATGAANPSAYIVDSAGAYLCDGGWSLRGSSCTLPADGAAKYLVLTAPDGAGPGPFALGVARVDGPPACPALPRGATATATTGAGHFVACYNVPADQHGSQERFTIHRQSGDGSAMLSVYDANGYRYCGPAYGAQNQPVTCYLPDGPVTVLMETGSTDATYEITHAAP